MNALPLTLELAADEHSRAVGLGGRRVFAPGEDGMLFVFDTPTRNPFWNRDTHLPLDLVLVDDRDRVAEIIPMRALAESGGVVESYTPSKRYVIALELPRGLLAHRAVPVGARFDVRLDGQPVRAMVVLRWGF